MLKSEDLLRGIFPKVSLETIYINLYNISRLRDVEKVLDGLEKNSGSNIPATSQSSGVNYKAAHPTAFTERERPPADAVREEAMKHRSPTMVLLPVLVRFSPCWTFMPHGFFSNLIRRRSFSLSKRGGMRCLISDPTALRSRRYI